MMGTTHQSTATPMITTRGSFMHVEATYQAALAEIQTSATGQKLSDTKAQELARTQIRREFSESQWQKWWQTRNHR